MVKAGSLVLRSKPDQPVLVCSSQLVVSIASFVRVATQNVLELAAVLEYITAEVFELVGNAARDSVVEDYINKKFILDRQAFFRLTNVNKSNNEQQM